MMKYKLLKDLPDINAGATLKTVTNIDNEHYVVFDKEFVLLSKNYIGGYKYPLQFVQDNPDSFAPYLFTSNDNVDIYKGDYVCVVTISDSIFEVNNCLFKDLDESCLYYSTKENAEQYLKNIQNEI